MDKPRLCHSSDTWMHLIGIWECTQSWTKRIFYIFNIDKFYSTINYKCGTILIQRLFPFRIPNSIHFSDSKTPIINGIKIVNINMQNSLLIVFVLFSNSYGFTQLSCVKCSMITIHRSHIWIDLNGPKAYFQLLLSSLNISVSCMAVTFLLIFNYFDAIDNFYGHFIHLVFYVSVLRGYFCHWDEVVMTKNYEFIKFQLNCGLFVNFLNFA